MKKPCKLCGKDFSKPINESLRRWNIRHFYCSKQCKIESMKGVKHSEEHRRKIAEKSIFQKGYVPSIELRRKIAHSKLGSKSHLWKGGITPETKRLRNGLEFALWKESVLKRDNHTCVWCGVKEVALIADHIKSWRLFPELRFDIDNGRALCNPCHRKTDTYGRTYTKRQRNNLGRFIA